VDKKKKQIRFKRKEVENMEANYQKAVEYLQKYKQPHILKELEKSEDKPALTNQILSIHWEELAKLYKSTLHKPAIESKYIEHISYTDKAKLQPEEKEQLDAIGIERIKNNQYAVVTMAGGQGTRLGHSGPKGTFLIEVEPEAKYLFQILAENLQKECETYGITIPWYIMTSRENHEETVHFFETHQYFGYPKGDVQFFKQSEMPLINTKGELLIDKNGLIKEASDGNGGIYSAMEKNGILKDMKEKGIEWIFIGGVDNILLNPVDTTLLGLTIKEKNSIASKSVVKTNPKERVGVFCKINGKPKIIEYTELPEEMAEEVDENGELMYGEVNILSHLYHISALEAFSKEKMPYHVAFKKASYKNEKGEWIEAKEPNAYKFEAFIFDAFEKCEDMTILRVKREDEFAPIKNANEKQVDCPDTARNLYNAFYAKKK